MPKIDPLPLQQVQPRPVGTPFSPSPGAGIARSGAMIAQGIGQVASVFAQRAREERAKNDEAAVNDKMAATFEGQVSIQQKMNQRTGLDAVGAGLDAVTEFNKLQEQMLESFAHENQRNIYRSRMLSHNRVWGIKTAAYEDEQVRLGRKGALDRNLTLSTERILDTASSSRWGLDEDWTKILGTELNEGAGLIMRYAQVENGEGPMSAEAAEMMNKAVEDWRSATIRSAIEAQLPAKADIAKDMREDMHEELRPSDRAALDKVLAPATMKHRALKAVSEAFDEIEEKHNFTMGSQVTSDMRNELYEWIESTKNEDGFEQRQSYMDQFLERRGRAWNAEREALGVELQNQVENLENNWNDLDPVALDKLGVEGERALRSYYDSLRGGGKQVTGPEGWTAYHNLLGRHDKKGKAKVPFDQVLQLGGVMAPDDYKRALQDYWDAVEGGPARVKAFPKAQFKDAWDVEMEDLYEGKLDTEMLYPAQYQAERILMDMWTASEGKLTRDQMRDEIRALLRPAFADGDKVGPIAATLDPRFIERQELEQAEFMSDPETIPSEMIPVLDAYVRTQAEDPDTYEPTEEDRARAHYQWVTGDPGANQYMYNRGFSRDVTGQTSQLSYGDKVLTGPKTIMGTRPTFNYKFVRARAIEGLEKIGSEVNDDTIRWAMRMIRLEQVAQEQFGGDMDAARKSMKLPPRPETLPQSTPQGQ